MPDFTSAVVEFKGERLTWTEVAGRLRAYDERGTAAAFAMGDLALALVPVGDDRTNNGAYEKLRAVAEESGVEYDVLYRRRLVAAAVEQVTRVTSVSWSAYREMIDATGNDPAERARLLALVRTPAPTTSGRWTVNAVRPLLGRRPITHTTSEPLAERVAEAPLAERTAAYEALANDPEVRQAVVDRAIQRAEAEREWAAPDEPTSSLADHEARMKEWRDTDVAHQYDDALVAWTTFAAAHPAEATAEAVARSPQTSSVVSYVQGAEVVSDWFRRFAQALRQEQRPRLVLAGAEGA